MSVWRSQVGHIRFTRQREQLQEDVPLPSSMTSVGHGRGRGLFCYLLDEFATFSGTSKMQPKILARDEEHSPLRTTLAVAFLKAVEAQLRL